MNGREDRIERVATGPRRNQGGDMEAGAGERDGDVHLPGPAGRRLGWHGQAAGLGSDPWQHRASVLEEAL